MAIDVKASNGYVRQDVAAKIDYSVDWSDFLGAAPGDAIAVSSWSCSPAGLSFTEDSIDDTSTVVFVSGGTVDVVYRIQNTITTTGGRTDVYSFFMLLVDASAAQPIPLVTALFNRFDSVSDFKASLAAMPLDETFSLDALSDDIIWENLVAAEAEASHQLRTFLQPTEVIPDSADPSEAAAFAAANMPYAIEDDYDFNPIHWDTDAWGYMVLRQAPVIDIHSVNLSYPSPTKVIMTIPTAWLQLDYKYGHLRFVPAGSLMAFGPMTSFIMSTFSSGRTLPGAMQIRYSAGLTNAKGDYPDLVNLVKRMAMLRVLKNTFLPNSSSISGDGLSQSVGIDIPKWQDGIDADLNNLRDQIKGPRLAIL